MRAAIGSQCKLMNRGVTCVLFGSLKINLAAVFWVNCRGLMELAGSPVWTEQEPEQGETNIYSYCYSPRVESKAQVVLGFNRHLFGHESVVCLVHSTLASLLCPNNAVRTTKGNT